MVKKPVPDKNIIYNMVKKHSRGVPGPWQYNVEPKWLKHQKMREFSVGPTREVKKLAYKWMRTPGEDGKREEPEDDIFAPDEKIKQKKIDKDASKNTFFDQLIRDNTRQGLPRPGPDYYFLDDQLLKKFPKKRYPEAAEAELFTKGPEKDKTRKECTSRAKRTFVLSEKEACGKFIPAPNAYRPKFPKSTNEKYTWKNPDPKRDPDELTFKTYV